MFYSTVGLRRVGRGPKAPSHNRPQKGQRVATSSRNLHCSKRAGRGHQSLVTDNHSVFLESARMVHEVGLGHIQRSSRNTVSLSLANFHIRWQCTDIQAGVLKSVCGPSVPTSLHSMYRRPPISIPKHVSGTLGYIRGDISVNIGSQTA